MSNDIIILSETVIHRGKEIPVSELSKGSNKHVEVECPLCGDRFERTLKSIYRIGHTKCYSCAMGGLGIRIIGMRFGRLVVTKQLAGVDAEAICDCGTKVTTQTGLLVGGNKKSCGCLRSSDTQIPTGDDVIILTEAVAIRGKETPVSELTKGSAATVTCKCPLCGDTFDLKFYQVTHRGHTKCFSCALGGLGLRIIGMRFGRLVVTERLDGNEVKAVCDCGSVEFVQASVLMGGSKKSCGCLRSEVLNDDVQIPAGDDVIILSETATRNGKEVPVSELTKGSHAVVSCKCPSCGMVLDLLFLDIAKRGHTKCRSCLYGGIGLNIVGQRFGRLVVTEFIGGSKVKTVCDCGTIGVDEAGQLTSGRKSSCGCATRQHMSEVGKKSKGKNHWNWRGGVANKRKNRRSSDAEHRAWSTAVLTRDNYVCDNCTIRKGSKVAHHLDNYLNHPEKRYDLSNGVTLCRECHIGFHAIYGQDCTAADYADFKRKYIEDPTVFDVVKKKPRISGRKCKLDWTRVRQIRKLYAAGGSWENDARFCEEFAEQYGVTVETIRVIIRNKAWIEDDYIQIE